MSQPHAQCTLYFLQFGYGLSVRALSLSQSAGKRKFIKNFQKLQNRFPDYCVCHDRYYGMQHLLFKDYIRYFLIFAQQEPN